MDKKICRCLLFLLVLLCLSGCATSDHQSEQFKEKEKISVVTTIYPMYDFVNKIGGDKVEVVNLVPAGIEPHDFELSTKDMELLEQSEMLIYNGSGMEHFMDKTLKSLSNHNLTVVEASKDIEALVAEDGDTDPHTWLSIENAKIECKTICDALCEIDPDNKEYYTSNLEAYQASLDELKAKYTDELKGCSKDTIVVAHEAFGYLCNEYGLKQEAIEGLTADSEPDSARMKEIIDLCREKDINVIFFEELVSPKVAMTIADETGATTMVLNPIEGITGEQEGQGLDYIGLMEDNLEALKTALK